MTYIVKYNTLVDGNTVLVTSEPLSWHMATTLLERINSFDHLTFVSMTAGE